MTNWRKVFAASADELITGMRNLGWHYEGTPSQENILSFQKPQVTIHVKLLSGVPFMWEAKGGPIDEETSKLLEGMM